MAKRKSGEESFATAETAEQFALALQKRMASGDATTAEAKFAELVAQLRGWVAGKIPKSSAPEGSPAQRIRCQLKNHIGKRRIIYGKQKGTIESRRAGQRGQERETAAKPHAESKPAPIDLSSVGGKLIAPPHVAGGERVDLSSCYGETGRALDEPETG